MNPELDQDVEKMLRAILHTGRYQSESEVFHEALSLLRRRDDLRNEIRAAIDEIDRGEGVDADEVFRDLEGCAARLAENGQ